VALINTLHRFSESLHAYGEFRRLWAEADDVESAKLLEKAENAAKAHPNMTPNLPNPHLSLKAKPSPVAGEGELRQSMGIKEGMNWLAKVCTDGVLGCVSIVSKALARVFRTSGKEGGLRDEF
jgi:hypothetical protein